MQRLRRRQAKGKHGLLAKRDAPQARSRGAESLAEAQGELRDAARLPSHPGGHGNAPKKEEKSELSAIILSGSRLECCESAVWILAARIKLKGLTSWGGIGRAGVLLDTLAEACAGKHTRQEAVLTPCKLCVLLPSSLASVPATAASKLAARSRLRLKVGPGTGREGLIYFRRHDASFSCFLHFHEAAPRPLDDRARAGHGILTRLRPAQKKRQRFFSTPRLHGSTPLRRRDPPCASWIVPSLGPGALAATRSFASLPAFSEAEECGLQALVSAKFISSEARL